MNLFGSPFSFANKAHLISLIVFLFILLAIPVTVYTVITSREPASKASSIGLHPNDSYYASSQWPLTKIRAPFAWEVNQGSKTVKVAVLSTGVSMSNPYNQDNPTEFTGQVVTGYNTVDNSTNTHDDFGSYGAGTHMASIIGAKTNNAFGVAGISWNTTIVPVKICGFSSCLVDDATEGVNWAVDNNVDIIAFGPRFSPSAAGLSNLTAAINRATSAGIPVITGTSNYSILVNGVWTSVSSAPGNLSNVTTVAVTTQTDTVPSYSRVGPDVDIAAPGEAIMVIVSGGCCIVRTDNSLAAAHVAGAASLLISAGVPKAQVTNALYQGAKDLGTTGRDDTYGNGLLDICGALNAAGKTCPVPDPAPVADIKANNSDSAISIAYNTSATISWTSTNATNCSVSPSGWTGVSGSQSTGNLTTTQTYTLSCTGSGGTAFDSVVVNVLSAGDTTKPTVSLTSPDSGQWVKGVVTISANASDNIGVTRVEFYVDGSLLNLDTSSPYSIAWDTNLGNSGNHSLTAKAFDAAGNNQTATAITVFVDNQPPTVDITSPANGATVSGTVNVTANATDNLGITKVELFVNGVPQGEDMTSPYSIPWNTLPLTNGNYPVEIRAVDNLQNISLDTVSVVVQNGDSTKPTSPVLNPLTSSGSSVTLNWTASTDNVGVTGYYVYRNNSLIAVKDAVTRTQIDNPPCGTQVTYVVRAYDAAGNVSDPSNSQSLTLTCPDTQAPTAPTNLSATVVSTSQINLSWTASTDNIGVAGYEVYRNATKVATIGTVTSYGDTGLSAGTVYTYYLRAFDGTPNYSANSNTVAATTQTPTSEYGNITGTVSSSAGGILVGAKVNFTVNGTKRSTITSSSGTYGFVSIPAGTYSLKYSAKQHLGQSQSVTVVGGSITVKNVTLQKR